MLLLAWSNNSNTVFFFSFVLDLVSVLGFSTFYSHSWTPERTLKSQLILEHSECGVWEQISLSISSDQGLALSSFMARVHSVGEIQHRKKITVGKGGWRTCESYRKTELLLLGLFQKKV